MVRATALTLLAAGLLVALPAGCGSGNGRDAPPIRVEGSDTMVNIAQAWAENYHREHPSVSVQVLGGGSGVGIASLIAGNCDMANASREMNSKEIQEATTRHGRPPDPPYIVGYDALAVYVHKDNPLDTISIDQLAGIFGQDGTITQWSQLDVAVPGGSDKIVRVCRQNSSGTYAYFREAVLGKERDYKLGSCDANGSKDVVALISRTPSAIGYSGMGYAMPGVKMLNLSRHTGQPGVAPTLANATNRTYPITRPLLIYTLGQPTAPVKRYLDWILSTSGQEVVLQLGYVPLSRSE
jgi:phosphate transport system substrate-binding protein